MQRYYKKILLQIQLLKAIKCQLELLSIEDFELIEDNLSKLDFNKSQEKNFTHFSDFSSRLN